MAAERDREGLKSAGFQQWYLVGAGKRVFRHTLVCTDQGTGLLEPLRDAAGLDYVGVAGAGIPLGGGAGNAAGARRCPVEQAGEFMFRYLGGAADQGVVGQVAYGVDDDTVTAERSATVKGIPVGRIAKVESKGRDVRVCITGYAAMNLTLFLGSWRKRLTLDPHALTLSVSTNYRVGVTLPAAFEEVTYCGELLCVDPAVGAKVVINRDTSRKAVDYCEWNVYVPPDTPGEYGGSVTFEVVAHFAGEGWPLESGPFPGVWDVPGEIL